MAFVAKTAYLNNWPVTGFITEATRKKPAGMSHMESSAVTEDDCCVSRENARRGLEETLVGRDGAKVAGAFDPVGAFPNPVIKFCAGHRFPNRPMSPDDFGYRFQEVVSHRRAGEMFSLHELRRADEIQSTAISGSRAKWNEIRQDCQPAKAPSQAEGSGDRSNRVCQEAICPKVHFLQKEEFYG